MWGIFGGNCAANGHLPARLPRCHQPPTHPLIHPPGVCDKGQHIAVSQEASEDHCAVGGAAIWPHRGQLHIFAVPAAGVTLQRSLHSLLPGRRSCRHAGCLLHALVRWSDWSESSPAGRAGSGGEFIRNLHACSDPIAKLCSPDVIWSCSSLLERQGGGTGLAVAAP